MATVPQSREKIQSKTFMFYTHLFLAIIRQKPPIVKRTSIEIHSIPITMQKRNAKLFFDPISGSLDDIHAFLDTINCPKFSYADVLGCYSSLIAQNWVGDTDDERAAREPGQQTATISRAPAAPAPATAPSSDSSTDEIESAEVEIHLQAPLRQRPATNQTFNVRWTKSETDALVQGLRRYGWGKWEEICESDPVLSGSRSSEQCLNRAKWLRRTKQLKL